MNAKLQEVLLDYGLEGYGLYWYCLELIASNVTGEKLTFELEHDCRIIARNTGNTVQKINEMMGRFIELELFEASEGKVFCLKLAKRADDFTAKAVKKNGIKTLTNQQVRLSPTKTDKVPLEEEEEEEKEQNIKIKSEVNSDQRKSKNIPYEKIWDSYKNYLNGNDDFNLIEVRQLTQKRKNVISKFWVQMERDIQKVNNYFQWLYDGKENHTWLFGDNSRNWVADIEFICRIETVVKAREGRLGNWQGAK